MFISTNKLLNTPFKPKEKKIIEGYLILSSTHLQKINKKFIRKSKLFGPAQTHLHIPDHKQHYNGSNDIENLYDLHNIRVYMYM